MENISQHRVAISNKEVALILFLVTIGVSMIIFDALTSL